jgi:hypothetical protein
MATRFSSVLRALADIIDQACHQPIEAAPLLAGTKDAIPVSNVLALNRSGEWVDVSASWIDPAAHFYFDSMSGEVIKAPIAVVASKTIAPDSEKLFQAWVMRQVARNSKWLASERLLMPPQIAPSEIAGLALRVAQIRAGTSLVPLAEELAGAAEAEVN